MKVNLLPNTPKKIVVLLFFCIAFTAYNSSAQTTYYVNDGSLTGDVLTTAIGNDFNSGTAAAPFATIAKANTVAVSGDIIMVDDGTYQENGFAIKGGVKISGVCATKTKFIVTSS